MQPDPMQTPDGAAVLSGRTASVGLALPRVQISMGPLAGRVALASLVVAAGLVTAFAAAGPSVLVPRSSQLFPTWEAGPLHPIFRGLPNDPMALSVGFSVVIVTMTIAYGVALAAVRTLSLRLIVVCIVALHAILLLSPPLQLTDVFNYLGYARLGGLHHLDPYTHVISAELHDPVYRFATWHGLHSPYGPLFTAATYLLPFGSLATAYWIIKAVSVLGSLGALALVVRCARLLGRDPRFALLFVATNPIYVIFAVGGFHNDFFMLVPMLGSVALAVCGRRRWAGAVLMLAVAVKFSAALLLPFLIVAAPSWRERRQVLVGATLGAVPLAAISVALFGFALPNLQDQSTLLTDFSIPNLVGLLIGIGGGTPGLLRVAKVALVLSVVWLLRRRGDWISRAGWATLALLASMAWLMPWYVIWVAPLAALGSSMRLRRATVAMTLFLVLTFVPATGILLSQFRLDPLSGPPGVASKKLQQRLAQ
jgi:alpha-1,6-mannosyltransferase